MIRDGCDSCQMMTSSRDQAAATINRAVQGKGEQSTRRSREALGSWGLGGRRRRQLRCRRCADRLSQVPIDGPDAGLADSPGCLDSRAQATRPTTTAASAPVGFNRNTAVVLTTCVHMVWLHYTRIMVYPSDSVDRKTYWKPKLE